MGLSCPEEMGLNDLYGEKKAPPKFGIKLHKTVNEAYTIDENGNTLWQDAIWKEMENVKITFQITPEGKETPNRF